MPESCKEGEFQMQSFGAQQPAMAQKVGDALKARGVEANELNFLNAIEKTLMYQVAALIVIFFLSFLLPAHPRSREEMEKLAAEGAMRHRKKSSPAHAPTFSRDREKVSFRSAKRRLRVQPSAWLVRSRLANVDAISPA